MVRGWLSRFMAGRYGGDQLNLFLIALYLVLYVVGLFTRILLLELIGTVVLVVSLFRTLSRNVERRRAENARFLQAVRPLQRWWTSAHDKEHRYFKCPNCGQQMRVPRGKGRITVHCRACGAAFEEKS